MKAGDVADDTEPDEELVEDDPEPVRGGVVVAMGPTDPPVLTPPPAPPPALEASVVERPPPPREPEGGSNHVSAWIAAGTGGVATAGGVVFAVLATSTSNASLDEPVASKAATLHDKALGQRTISIVGFVVAGAALGTAAVLYFTDAP